METGKVFKTKTGFCHILRNQIVFTADESTDTPEKGKLIDSISILHLILIGTSFSFLYFSFSSYSKGDVLDLLINIVGAIICIYNLVIGLNNSTKAIIERRTIKDAKYKKGINGLTFSRVEILFQDDDGKNKKRLVLFPVSSSDQEKEAALKIMMDEKIILT
jgi:hypothetical protein